jgi:hypothetical protein
MIDIQQHIKDFPDFKETGEAMTKAWVEGVDMSCKLPLK